MEFEKRHRVSIPWTVKKFWDVIHEFRCAFESSHERDIVMAQYANLRLQIPILYLLLVVTALAVFYTFMDAAPLMLLTAVTTLIVSISVVRFVSWLKASRAPEELGIDEIRGILRRSTFAVIPISLVYVGYALVLDQYAGPVEQAGLAVCVVLTAIGCIFCLSHLPAAGLLVHVLTMVPYTVYHLYEGHAVFVMVALNAAIVTTLMLRVSRNAFQGFTELIISRAELATQRIEAQRLAIENERLAMTDALTNLPNRRLFFARLEDRINGSDAGTRNFVVGVLDLDRFKPINDVYGHAVGDQLLGQVGDRLQSLAGVDAVVARLGGDEFELILGGDVRSAAEIADRMLELLHRPFRIEGQDFNIGGSIGFACYPGADCTASVLFDRADYALYDAKIHNRGKYRFFTQELETRQRSETEMETALLSADLERELSVELQPIVCLKTGATIGIEALGRWENTQIGRVEPIQFFEAAERLNLMNKVTTTLFRKFVRDARELPEDLSLSFNLSTHDIVSASTIDHLLAVIVEESVRPERVTFEITETALVRDYQVAAAHLERMRSLGFSIALDDFGTGFSNLSYINRLPIDKLKVDRSFLSDLTEPSSGKIVDVILGMCKKLDLECIVEGVETQEQLHHLLKIGCTKAQGFLFSPPLKIGDLKAWLDDDASRANFTKLAPGLPSLRSYVELQDLYARSRQVR